MILENQVVNFFYGRVYVPFRLNQCDDSVTFGTKTVNVNDSVGHTCDKNELLRLYNIPTWDRIARPVL